MYAEKAVISVHRDLKVHTSYHPNPHATSTIILVNGSLATSASFNQTLRYLRPLFNVVLFDMPYSGQSRPYNPCPPIIGKEDEALILLELIEHFRADQVFSFSWGGVATLLALAQRPERIKRAIISSFSPVLNSAMRDYLAAALTCLAARDRPAIGQLINGTIGEFLPSFFKRCNFRHTSTLEDHEYAQMLFHIRQVLGLHSDNYMGCAGNIDVPLLFINGEWDRYTSPDDAQHFGKLASQAEFATIRHCGHFLEMEHKTAWQEVREVAERFLLAEAMPVAERMERMAMAG
ncbi:MAG TPA: alpha/beta hydrolase [Pseudomonas xinjiangensis]|uniref:Alpha/beta hydrolase n=2 Tax=root TaxID=1 RepID=A0A7V1BMP2_9GAMM|nr:alpha/beta hydrolase [Halopseudomonas xinjiangensis]HEC46819.1 alpha/beta hydrolase [Halopseudomonas xinjiangensis]